VFYRVTIKVKGKLKRFWAQRLGRSKSFTRYRRVNNEGRDFGYYRKNGALIDKQDLISNSLIVSEKPAIIDKKYGTMRIK